MLEAKEVNGGQGKSEMKMSGHHIQLISETGKLSILLVSISNRGVVIS